MRVLNVSGSGCGRMVKTGIVLQEMGHEVINLSNQWSDNAYFPHMDIMSYWENVEQLHEKLLKFQSVDIIHVHSEPKMLAQVVRDALPNAKIIFDVHDSELFVKGEELYEEIASRECADALIFPCKGYAEKLADGKPFEIIYNKAHSLVAQLKPMPLIGGVVYQGGLGDEKFAHRDYRNLADWFTESNVPFHIFTSHTKAAMLYGGTGAMLYGAKHQYELMQTLTRFHWGLAASPDDKDTHPQWKVAMPHKMYDYAASGLPVLTWGDTEMAKYIIESRCGIVLSCKEELLDRYGEYREIKESLADRRDEFTMASEGIKLVAFYEKILNG